MAWISKMKAGVGAVALALVSAAGTAQAEMVTYTFTAVVDRVLELQGSQGGYVDSAELEGHHMTVNDRLTGRISFDAADPSWSSTMARTASAPCPSSAWNTASSPA